jgi:hypothetical protein
MFSIGTRVRITNTALVNGEYVVIPDKEQRYGVIKGYTIMTFQNVTDYHYIVELDYGFYNEGKRFTFVSLLVVHNANTEEVNE